jgi:hypothetical protein
MLGINWFSKRSNPNENEQTRIYWAPRRTIEVNYLATLTRDRVFGFLSIRVGEISWLRKQKQHPRVLGGSHTRG